MVAKNLYIFNFKIIFIIKSIFLISALVIIELSISFNLDKINDNPSFRVGKKIVNQINSMNFHDVDLLIFGDSSCNAGIDTKIINKRTGMRVEKLAPPARFAQMSGYFFLKTYLKKNSPPKMLLDIRTPSFMSRNWNPDLFFDNFFTFSDLYQLINDGVIDPKEYFLIHIPNVLPSFRNRFAIRRLLAESTNIATFNGLFSQESSDFNEIKAKNLVNDKKLKYDRMFTINNGQEISVFYKNNTKTNYFILTHDFLSKNIRYKKESDQHINIKINNEEHRFNDITYDIGLKPYHVIRNFSERLTTYDRILSSDEKIFTKVDQYYINKMLKLCKKYNIKYYFFFGPIFDGLYDQAVGRKFFNKASSEFELFAKEHSEFHFLSKKIEKYPFEMLSNSTEHVNRTGQILYSNTVSNNINDVLH